MAVLKAVIIVVLGMLIVSIASIKTSPTLPKNETTDNIVITENSSITDSTTDDIPPYADKNGGYWADAQWTPMVLQDSQVENVVSTHPATQTSQAEPNFGELGENSNIVDLAPQISAYSAGEAYYYNISREDKVYIAKMVYAESRGEPLEGKVAVAAVALNRYVSDNPFFENDTIYSVIMQSGQFASISWITESDLESVPECMEAVELACKGWDPTREVFEDGALFFYAPNGDISDAELARREGVLSMTIGNHVFHHDFND